LQLGNAHLNLRSLGAVGVQYHANLYGPMGGINGGLPSDRLVVEWQLVGDRVAGAESIDVEVPPVTADEIANAAPPALHARVAMREAMLPLLDDGWIVIDVDRVGRTYTLSR
jgi:predicted GNAT superfamily acetyltransferase